MTTFAELKSSLSRALFDVDAGVFEDDDLGDFLNTAIAEISRVAPQTFEEDIPAVDGQLTYVLHGGTGNLISNPSFEEGDESILNTATLVAVAAADSSDLTHGWTLDQDASLGFVRSVSLRKTGLYVGALKPDAGDTNVKLYQDIPVNPDTVYVFSGWHAKLVTGGLAARIRLDTLDASSVVVDTGVFTHDTTSPTMVPAATSIAVPDDGSVAYIRVNLMAAGVQPATRQTFYFEDISLIEQSDSRLVATTARTEIEVAKVEIWDGSTDPESYIYTIPSAGSAPLNSSEGGWTVWRGMLRVPTWVESQVDATTQFYRIWGYAPYDRLTSASQVTDLSDELEFAAIERARIEGVKRLIQNRMLFTQWQTRSNNTDITPAGLMNDLSLSEESWRRQKREMTVLRERS
jgi:hypothetical protein